MSRDWDGRVARLARSVFERTTASREFTQLRTATTLEAIRPAMAVMPRFTFRDAALADRAYLLRLAELERPLRERRRDPGVLPLVAGFWRWPWRCPNSNRRARTRTPRLVPSLRSPPTG